MEEMRRVGYSISDVILSTSDSQYHTDMFKDFAEDAQFITLITSGPIDAIQRGAICDLRIVFELIDVYSEVKTPYNKDIKDVLCVHVFARLDKGHPVWEYHFMKP